MLIVNLLVTVNFSTPSNPILPSFSLECDQIMGYEWNMDVNINDGLEV